MRSELTGVLCHLRVFKQYGYFLILLCKVSGTDTHLTAWSVLCSPRSVQAVHRPSFLMAPVSLELRDATVGMAVRCRDGFCTDVRQHSTAKASGAPPCVRQPEARHPVPSLSENRVSPSVPVCTLMGHCCPWLCEAVGGKRPAQPQWGEFQEFLLASMSWRAVKPGPSL